MSLLPTPGSWRGMALRSPEEGGAGEGGQPPSPARQRASSVQFRTASPQAEAQSMLDPANQSLSEALSLLFRLVLLGCIVLVALYFASGFGRINEGERGIRLIFGREQRTDLEPGFAWSLPAPFGELVRVPQGVQEVRVDRDFWVYVAPGTVDPSPDKLVPTGSLNPAQEGAGSVLTADGNIAHTQWRVTFRRGDAGLFARNVSVEHEQMMVRMAVQRGVVRACAEVTIDELLKRASDSEVSIRAREVAQRTLDEARTGLVIDQLTLEAAIPPLAVRADFAKVQSAVSRAAEAREKAATDAQRFLAEAAGDAAPVLIREIDAYELALARGDQAEQTQVLARIDQSLLSTQQPRVSGRAATLLSEARQYRSETVARAQSDLSRFQAKVQEFAANPLVMVHREWSEAYRALLGRPTVNLSIVPPGQALTVLRLSRDPDVSRALDRERKRRENEETQRRQQEEMRRQQFMTPTGQTEVPG